MLYLWPYILFFSFPLICPVLFSVMVPRQYLPSFLCSSRPLTSRPRLIVAIPVMALMLAVVHYNTIIHPFTLADNRHYMFYIFKLLRSHPSIKYLVVPVYFICAWSVLAALTVRTPTAEAANGYVESTASRGTKSFARVEANEEGQRASWLLIWLATTTLSLCTAPLVEPRYCILPWMFWRMNVPTFAPGDSKRLWLETLWLLLINAITGYMFLYRGFEWPQEPGSVQRFMW